MKFSYRARTKEGEVKTGFIEASSKKAALDLLEKYGLYVTNLTQLKKPFWQRRITFFGEVSRGDLVFFTRQLAIMLRSEIPVVESLETIARQSKKIDFQEKILKIAEAVEGGDTLSEAFSIFPKIFSPFYIGVVKSGETSGRVPENLEYLADYLEKEQDFISKTITSLVYPTFVFFFFIAILILMSIFVVPQFAPIFAEAEVPFSTKIIFKISDFLRKNWLVFLLIFFGICFSPFFILKSKEGKNFWDRISLNLPILGDLFKKIYLARLSLNLSTLISGGVPIVQALEVTGNMVGNDLYKEIIFKTRDEVKGGKNISSILSYYSEIFSPLFLQMITVGEKTGHLEKTLENVVDFYQKEVERTLERLVKFLEPALIVILAVLVAIFIISFFLPLYQIFTKGLTIYFKNLL